MILNLSPLVNTYLTFRLQLNCHLCRAFSSLLEKVKSHCYIYNKTFKLAQREALPLPAAPGRYTSSWEARPHKNTFVYLRDLSTKVTSTVSAQPPGWRETEASHVGGQPGLRDWGQIKTLDTKNWLRFPSWQFPRWHIVARKVSAICDSIVRRQLEALSKGLSQTLPMYLFPWLNFICSFHCHKP